MSAGLDALKSRGRGERKKPIPPPRHSPRSTPVEVPETEPEVEAVTPADSPVAEPEVQAIPTSTPAVDTTAVAQPNESSPAAEPAAATPSASIQGADEAVATPAQQTNVVTAESMAKKTVFIGAGEEALLRQVVVAGMMHPGGKVDSNQSATIRLALRRLQAEMTPEQIVEEIRRGLTKTGESGRPRF